MTTLLVAIGSFFGFILAYHTYGRWLARRIFGLDKDAIVPSQQLRDDIDFVPTKKEVIFGHHFTSIAGTGPIVGPAIAVFWGWLPALIWVVLGSIFIGAVHDFDSGICLQLLNEVLAHSSPRLCWNLEHKMSPSVHLLLAHAGQKLRGTSPGTGT